MRLISGLATGPAVLRRRIYSRPKPRASTSFAHDRLARRLALLSFGAAVVVAFLYGAFALATEDSGLRRDTEQSIRDAMEIASVSLQPAIAARDDAQVRQIVAAVSRAHGVAWARVEIDLPGDTAQIVESGLPDAPTITEHEKRFAPGSVLVVGVDRDRVDERLRRGLVRQIVTSFVISLAGAGVVFLGFQSSLTRHVERIADAIEKESRSVGLGYEQIVLERVSTGSERAPDTLDRLAAACNALLESRARTMGKLQNAADMFEERASERAAAAEAERLRLRDMVVSSSDLMFETDRDGRFVYFAASPKADQLDMWLGGGLSGFELCPDADARQRAALTRFLALLARMAPIRNAEFRVRGPAGQPMWIVVNATPVFAAASPEPVGLRGCITDITDLTDARERAARGERMTELGQLVAGVAHEINTPAGVALTFATSIAEMLAEARRQAGTPGVRDGAGPPDAVDGQAGPIVLDAVTAADIYESAQGVERNLRRVHQLVSSFKQISGDQASDQARRFDLGEYLRDTSLSLSAEWQKRAGRKLRIEAPDGLVMLSYPGAVAQIVSNLVMNGLLHAFAGRPRGEGVMTFTASADAARPGWLTLDYEDDGAGIEPETLRHIFEPFFTTRRGSGGTGLGLSIVRSLVDETLGGEVTASSEPGRGLRISMRLPAIAPGAEADADEGDEGDEGEEG